MNTICISKYFIIVLRNIILHKIGISILRVATYKCYKTIKKNIKQLHVIVCNSNNCIKCTMHGASCYNSEKLKFIPNIKITWKN